MKKIVKRLSLLLLCAAFLVAGSAVGINAHIKHTAAPRILSPDEAAALTDVDCILVLGCGVRENGQPSSMLQDRLTRGIELYRRGASPKLLMSGDHGREHYDEVNTMKRFAVEANVPSQDIFMDHAGFSTYESMYRAKEIFKAEKIIIVTQEYHLYRALYIAEKLGIEAYGVSADYRSYGGQFMRDVREILARCKDAATVIVRPKPTYLGEPISLNGNGDITND